MSVASGTNGSVTNASGYSTAVIGWTADISIAELDITSWDDATSGVIWREFLSGIREWTGTITARWDPTDTILAGVGTELSVTLIADTEQGASGVGLSGTVRITGIGASVEIEGVAAVQFTFRGSGAPTAVVS